MGLSLDNIKPLDDDSLRMNYIGARALVNVIQKIDSEEKLKSTLRSTFNRMAECLDDDAVSFMDATRFNLLGILLDAGLDLKKAVELAEHNVKLIEAEMEKRDASSPSN